MMPQHARIDNITTFIHNVYSPLLVKARAGCGVAHGWQHFLDDDFAAGRLVQPLAETVTTRFGYALLVPNAASAPPEARVLRDWILAERR